MTDAVPVLLPVGGIIKRDEAAIWSEAAVARDALLAERAELANARSQSLERAQAEGRAAGLEEGRRQAADVVLSLSRQIRTQIDLIEQRLPELVMDVVTRLLGQFQPGELLTAAINHAVSELRAGMEATIKVAPQHFDQVKMLLLAMEARPGAPRLHLQTDATMQPDACQLIGHFGSVDLTLSEQLAMLRDGLAGSWSEKAA